MKDSEPPEFSSNPLAYGMDAGIADQVAARARISRRDFLKILSAAVTGTALASACARVGLTPVGSGPISPSTPDNSAITAIAPTETINTRTPTPEPTATATKEPEIGGTTAVVLWRDYKTAVVPPRVCPVSGPDCSGTMGKPGHAHHE